MEMPRGTCPLRRVGERQVSNHEGGAVGEGRWGGFILKFGPRGIQPLRSGAFLMRELMVSDTSEKKCGSSTGVGSSLR
jgi:hypothetical protein